MQSRILAVVARDWESNFRSSSLPSEKGPIRFEKYVAQLLRRFITILFGIGMAVTVSDLQKLRRERYLSPRAKLRHTEVLQSNPVTKEQR